MDEIRYHPLVDCDTEGSVKVSMFCTTDEAAVKKPHSLYLQEIVPHYFRLYANNTNRKLSKEFDTHCPVCGSNLKRIGNSVDDHKLGLYRCMKCAAHK